MEGASTEDEGGREAGHSLFTWHLGFEAISL